MKIKARCSQCGTNALHETLGGVPKGWVRIIVERRFAVCAPCFHIMTIAYPWLGYGYTPSKESS